LGAEALALYAFITAIPDRLLTFLKFIPSAALPKFSEKTEDQIRQSISPKLLLLTLLGVAGALLYIVIAPEFFAFFFPAYTEAVPYSQIYSLMIVGLAGSVSVSALIAQGRKKDLYLLNTTTPILQIVLQLIAVLVWGLWGLVAAKAASTVLSGGIAWYLFVREPRKTQE
jgi:O-antigen/teichoic acid export membrane protein